MGVPDSSLLDLLVKVKSWISWSASDLSPSCFFPEFVIMSNSRVKMCCDCHAKFSEFLNGYHCQSCGKWLCANCLRGYESPTAALESCEVKGNVITGESLKACKFCNRVDVKRDDGKKNGEKVHPLESPRESPEPLSPSISGDTIQSDRLAHYLESRDCGYSPCAVNNRSMNLFSAHPSPVSVCSTSRSDEDDADNSGNLFCSPLSEFYHDMSDIDSNGISNRLEFYSYKSAGSSPLDSPSRISFTSYRNGHPVHGGQGGSPLFRNAAPFDPDNMAVLGRPGKGTQDSENTDDYTDDLTTIQNHHEKPQKPLEFENNGLLWFPPPPEDENDEAECGFFTYDDDEDDIGDSGAMFSSSDSLSSTFPSKDRQDEGNKEPLRAVIQGHFRALVSQLLQGENIRLKNEDGSEVWLDVVTNIAWQAANFVKPDTSKGGSMDPIHYVKVKCIASGRPGDSTVVKGVVCTKNIKHKRMTKQYKNPRLLLLGGALECQSVVNPLASFQTLVQQENDHLKRIISKIEALRPNVLLVERSVSPYAQEYLPKDISLVLNVKKPLLERISRCTGALISPSIDNISTTQLGHCELFRVERVSEEHETANQSNKKASKTLMFFEGCPRRLGCTVILKGSNREGLKKVKHVVQYAIFAAYHLSLETSFLADEGASLPKITLKHSIAMPERIALQNAISVVPSTDCQAVADTCAQDDGSTGSKPGHPGSGLLSVLLDNGGISALSAGSLDYMLESTLFDAFQDYSASNVRLDTSPCKDLKMSTLLHSGVGSVSEPDLQDVFYQEKTQLGEAHEPAKVERIDENEVSSEYFSAADTYQSILVSFLSRRVLKGAVCERFRPLRIKFYGSFDKPLGRYLRDDLFDQTSYCRFCNEPAEAHVLCYTHQQGNLTINVRSLPSVNLPGERDGKIWMWHRCLRCAHIDGVPPATRRVVMSDAAWGLSFGKFLELSFSNHATANRVAPCGHSLQRDCLRFYGFGSMVAFFRYSPIDILNVHLPPSILEFNGHIQQDWIRKEAAELLGNMEAFYEEISDVLDRMELKSKSSGNKFSDTNELLNHIVELKDQLCEERNDYNGMLQPAVMESSQPGQTAMDILELNRLRRALVISSHVWDRQLYSLDSLLKTNSVVKAALVDASYVQLKELTGSKDVTCNQGHEEKASGYGLKSEMNETSSSVVHEGLLLSGHHDREDEVPSDGDSTVNRTPCVDFTGDISNLSDRIDSVWTGTYQLASNAQPLHASLIDGPQNGSVNMGDNPPLRKLMAPARVHSFDSALRIRKGLLPSSLHLSTLRSFHASGDFRTMLRGPVSSTLKTYSQMLPLEAWKMDLISSAPSLISSASHLTGGARLLVPHRSQSDVVVGVYDDDAASIVSYALSSKEYEDWIESDGNWTMNEQLKGDSGASTFSAWQSFGSLDLDFIRHGSEDAPSSVSTLPIDSKRSPHITISYGDDSPVAGGKVKFSVICYFAKQFDSLRKRCCPSEVDFLRSLSRCHRWSAQGGKSNVYFARSLDERFIIKQVKKTELESFEEFAPEYFEYLMDSLKSRSPTCLAKILGIYQVTVKHLKGGKEVKMDLMVMENLFYGRSIDRVYDLKGSARSRYNPDTSGRNKVLLDMNLVEALRTEPIFLGSKAKRSLERAIWNDTSFLASVDVMDYSLLVGVDKERKELVLGIIDFMRQYTWDKQLETWVKASGILGGPKNASPTIISPKQYKTRFRKAMTSYFLTVPDQWSS